MVTLCVPHPPICLVSPPVVSCQSLMQALWGWNYLFVLCRYSTWHNGAPIPLNTTAITNDNPQQTECSSAAPFLENHLY